MLVKFNTKIIIKSQDNFNYLKFYFKTIHDVHSFFKKINSDLIKTNNTTKLLGISTTDNLLKYYKLPYIPFDFHNLLLNIFVEKKCNFIGNEWIITDMNEIEKEECLMLLYNINNYKE